MKRNNSIQKSYFIIGAGEAGQMVLREIQRASMMGIQITGFLDDKPEKIGTKIDAITVIGRTDEIQELSKKENIYGAILAMPSASYQDRMRIIQLCEQAQLHTLVVPSTRQIIEGEVRWNQIRSVEMEELLGRDEVVLETQPISALLQNKTLLITGAGGSIGSELCRQAAVFNPKRVLLFGHGENSIYKVMLELQSLYSKITWIPVIADIQNISSVRRIFASYHPDVVFHAAAHKHVPLMEQFPVEAIWNNVVGTQNMVEVASENATAHFVMISTDKAVNPISVMGMTKRIAELITLQAAQKKNGIYVCVRFGNVLASRGSVVEVFKQQIKQGGPITVTDAAMVRYFMTIPEASRLVLQSAAYGRGGEIVILDMGQPVKIIDLARQLIRLSGLDPDKDIAIEITGIRPGEKLHEELLNQHEKQNALQYKKLYITAQEKTNLKYLKKDIDNLIKSIDTASPQIIKNKLRSIIAQYEYKINTGDMEIQT